MCAIDRATLLAKQGMIGVVQGFVAPSGSVCIRGGHGIRFVVGALFMCVLGVCVMFAFGPRWAYKKAESV